MDLIDRKHFQKRFLKTWEWCEKQGFNTEAFKYVDELIETEVPFAHPEIIECKECQHFEIAKNKVNGFCTKHGIWFDVNDYCSRAEKLQDDNTKNNIN